MPDFDYIELADVAEELVDEFGRNIQLIPPSSVSSDPERPWSPPEDDAAITMRGVFIDFNKNNSVGLDVQSGDKMLVLASKLVGDSPDIDHDHVVVDEGVRYRIVPPINEKKPGPVSLVYFLHLRA